MCSGMPCLLHASWPMLLSYRATGNVRPRCRTARQHFFQSVLVWSKNSCGFARVVFQEAPEPFATLHRACTFMVLADRRKEQDVALTLMIPLGMKMLEILRQYMVERRFPEQD